MTDYSRREKETCYRLAMAFFTVVLVTMSGCRSMSHVSDIASTSGLQGMELRDTADIQLYDMEDGPDLPSQQTDAQVRTPTPEAGGQGSESPFPTFKETGDALCTDDEGRPQILLFSASSCSHCQWVGGIFDVIAKKYTDQGLIAAHHYDIESADDLLTDAVENQIPKRHLSIGRGGDPDGYLPYFNFGCRYDRIGTGYEEQNDLAAEAQEMCQVIETLLP